MKRLLLLLSLVPAFLCADDLDFYKSSEHFRVFCTAIDWPIVDDVLNREEAIFEQLSVDFDHTYSEPIILKIYPSIEAFQGTFPGGAFQAWAISSTSLGVGGHTYCFVSPQNPGSYHTAESIMQLLPVGLTRLFIKDIYGTEIPRWLSQGIGLWKAKCTYDKTLAALANNPAKIPSIQQLEEVDNKVYVDLEGFAVSCALAEFLHQKWGWETMCALLADYEEFEGTLQISKEEFNQQFVAFVVEKYGSNKGENRAQGDLALYKSSKHFQCYCTADDQNLVSTILQREEDLFSRLSADFNHQYSAPTITLQIYPSIESLQNALGMSGAPHWLVSYVVPDSHLHMVVSPKNPGDFHTFNSIISVLMIGLSELFIRDMYKGMIPLWLIYGIGLWKSQLGGHSSSLGYLASHPTEIPSILRLELAQSAGEFSMLYGFEISYALLEFLYTHWNWRVICSLLANYADFENILHISKTEFDRQFVAFVTQKYGSWATEAGSGPTKGIL